MALNIFHSDSEYTLTTPYPQQFSLPPNLIYHITQYPCSFQVHQKLQKTCKYFYSKNPVIVVETVSGKPERISFGPTGCQAESYTEETFNPSFKIWVTEIMTFENYHGDPFDVKDVFRKIFRYEVDRLCLRRLNLSFDELTLFASSPRIHSIWFDKLHVQYANGDTVPLEKIIELFPGATSLIL